MSDAHVEILERVVFTGALPWPPEVVEVVDYDRKTGEEVHEGFAVWLGFYAGGWRDLAPGDAIEKCMALNPGMLPATFHRVSPA